MFNLAKIELTAKNNPKTTTNFYIADVSQEQKLVAGTLFILIEINSTKTSDIKLTNFLLNLIPQQYYQNKKFKLREQLGATPIEDILESCLAAVNKKLKTFCQQNRIKLTNKHIQIIVGAIYENLLVLSTVGNVKALLFTFSDRQESDKQYKTLNILKTAINQPPLNLEANLFSNILAGPLPAKSFVLLGNEALFEYLSQAQIAKIISTLPPASAAEQIKNMLSTVNAYISFVGLILKSQELNILAKPKIINKQHSPLPAKPTGFSQPYSQTSIINLNKTEETTEKLLMPTGLIKLKFLKKWRAKISNFSQKKKNSSLIFAKKQAKSFSLTAKNFSPKIWQAVKNCKLTPNKILKRIKLNKKLFNLKQLKTKKIYLVISLLAIILFSFNIYQQKQRKQQIAQNMFYLNLSQRIAQKLNQTEASLLYNNKTKAKQLLSEINELLKQLPQQTTEQKNKWFAYQNRFNEFRNLIRQAITIKKLKKIADLKNLSAQAEPESLSLEKNNLFLSDQKKPIIYQIDLETKIASIITLASSTKLKYPAQDKQNNIYYFNENKKNIIKFNPQTKKITALALPPAEQTNAIKGLAIYNNYLYLLLPEQNQIKKLSFSPTRLTKARDWLKEKIKLNKAVDIDIDGFIYVLEQNDHLIRLLRGRRTNFSLEAVDPPLKNPQKANIYLNSGFLYILTTHPPRLIIYNKQGKFLAQIYFPADLKNIADFAIDEKKSLIFILAKTNIYQAQWPKIKPNQE